MLLAALLALGTTIPGPDAAAETLAAVRAVLRRAPEGPVAREETLVRSLVALGPGAAPVLFELVTGAGLDALLGDDPPAAWQCELERVDDLALAALAALPPEALRAFLATRCREAPRREVRMAALTVLAANPAPEAVPLLLSMCNDFGLELEQRSLREPALAALTAMLQGDWRALRGLGAQLATASPGTRRLACEALARCGRAEAAALLTRLGEDPALELPALLALTELGARFPWSLGESVAARLRSLLTSARGERRMLAAHGLGRLRDGRAVPELIGCLTEADADLVGAALWSLREITGETRLERPRDWVVWLKREQAWWTQHGQPTLTSLATASPETLTGTLRELARHPIGRDQVAEALCAALPQLPPDARIVACDALARLRAARSAPSLVVLLDEDDPRVSAAAVRALAALTGASLPATAQAWRAYLSG